MNEQNEIQPSDGISMSMGEKLINIITAPTVVFEHIREKVTWQDYIIPLLIAVAFVGISSIVSAPYTLELTKKAIKAQSSRVVNQDMSEEQRQSIENRFQEQIDKQEERYSPPKVYYWSFLRALGGIGLSLMVLAGIYYFSGNTILAGQTAFPKVLALVTLPQMVKVIESVYNMVFVSMTNSIEVPSSLAVFLPYGMTDVFSLERYQQAMFTLLSQIDIFTVWRMVLFTIGFSIIYKVSKGKAAAVVFGWWTFWMVITTAGSFLFAGLAG
ncbi:MAG: hypothetical protein MAGBODY4_01448 [Candidatus Marinimicrobia bacterium]|nr:hypothetical protein [Candidatus Neomarinimicrobiota bacterium]